MTNTRLTALIPWLIIICLTIISVSFYVTFLQNGLGLAYNDARSHLDIGRRVVEGLHPGAAQLGSVWLPLNHVLMIPTIWNDFMWHTGLAGSLQSMIAFVATGLLTYKFLEKLNVGMLGRLVGVAVFAANLNVLYLQSTAMTELLLIFTMTAGCYYLLLWHQDDAKTLHLVNAAFWIMLSTLVRYDGWFLLGFSSLLVLFHAWRAKGWSVAEGAFFLFITLAGIGVVLWFLWNLAIFKDPLYFAFGPFSAHTQQQQLKVAGDLLTQWNLWLSLKIYIHAMFYNLYTLPVIFGFVGALVLWFDKRLSSAARLSTLALTAPFIFNVVALFLGFSVLFVQGISGNSFFNVRYGIMLIPSVAIFIGYLVDKVVNFRWVIICLLAFVLFFAFANPDSVTLDDARVGSSGKNVTEVSGWLAQNVPDKQGFILISVASHDAIIFSSGLPMKRFIHEGTGAYWESAVAVPDRWARWIIVRTHDDNDLVWREIKDDPELVNYNLVGAYPFADIYELKPEYVDRLTTTEVFKNQK